MADKILRTVGSDPSLLHRVIPALAGIQQLAGEKPCLFSDS
ncbi:hypothetical protein [Neptunicella sp.]